VSEPPSSEPPSAEPSATEPSAAEPSAVAPGLIAVTVRPQPSRQPARTPRWLVAAVIAWGLVLAAGLVWSVRSGAPTAREQTTVAQARPTVDEATANVARAATAGGRAVVAISGFDRLGDCRITALRRGARYQRIVTAFVSPGQEAATLDRIAAGLPSGYGATVRRGAAPRLTADAGFFVGVSGGYVAPGQLRFVVDTGNCRVETAPLAPGPGVASETDPPAALQAPIDAVLTSLRVARRVDDVHRVLLRRHSGAQRSGAG
jgi:hypothetical protein